ncbi:TetR/AcrR family transcriptional regulator [Vibrio sp. ZSDE26]|uniref:TetR/AcrR family transcriptional regulator n=1 Tax=Vibrio amylolyticus TaxID=2847292 RepID=A0A9X2BIG2_9VIBR|nr:TetR/AcrR family transcriptional regulator [Vibrio amylolyticus]MCK6264080.1 TetR/AcrR family transcriptional regulator [Vibrio amylolyticus]
MKRTEIKRLAIIDAARAEFIEKGFLEANMDNVCKKADVSKRTLYRHFESKERLFSSILKIVQDSATPPEQYRYTEEKTLQEQLTEITLAEIDTIFNQYGIPLSRVIIMEFLRQPKLATEIAEQLNSTKGIELWVETAAGAGRLNGQDTSLMVQVYGSLLKGLTFWPNVMINKQPSMNAELRTKVDTIVSVFLAAYAVNS